MNKNEKMTEQEEINKIEKMDNDFKELSEKIEKLLNPMLPDNKNYYNGDWWDDYRTHILCSPASKIIPYSYAKLMYDRNTLEFEGVTASFGETAEYYKSIDEFMKTLEEKIKEFKESYNFINEDVKEKIKVGKCETTLAKRMRKKTDNANKRTIVPNASEDEIVNYCYEKFLKKINESADNGYYEIRTTVAEVVSHKAAIKYQITNPFPIYKKVLEILKEDGFEYSEKNSRAYIKW